MKWGLVLSGGAACGFANGGVLSVFEREGLRPDAVAGSSMGAIIGGLYAAGFGMDQCMELCKSLHLFNVATWSSAPLRRGLHSGVLRQRLEERLVPLLGDRTIGECDVPFVCIAGLVKNPIKWRKIVQEGFVDYLRGLVTPYVFPPDTRLIDAMLASSAIPVVFSPVEFDGKIFVDLCTFGAIPARSLRQLLKPDIVIATDTTPAYAIAPYLPKNWRAFLVAAREELQRSKDACDLVIKPKLAAPPFRFDRTADFIDAGKIAAEKALPDIHALLQTRV